MKLNNRCSNALRYAVLAFVISAMLQVVVDAQKKRNQPSNGHKPSSELSADTSGSPVSIVMAGIGRHKDGRPVCSLFVTNNDLKRAITRLKWSVATVDVLMKEMNGPFSLEAEPLTAIKPRDKGIVIVQLEKYLSISNCRNFEAQINKSNSGEEFITFSPKDVVKGCTGDLIIISIDHIKYDNGTEWPTPAKENSR